MLFVTISFLFYLVAFVAFVVVFVVVLLHTLITRPFPRPLRGEHFPSGSPVKTYFYRSTLFRTPKT